ncbi:MAG: glutamine-hydrolyzing carbamoyl-phosphate synthase small subunit [Clostridia bacterium]|nr:glutamine-hydrolyzing carbamoyl-phosphate synthase small subunit [Clostridia bacterium]
MNGFDKKIILEDGEEYFGYSFGASDDKVLEIVFNTSMVGYQEIISDPSYTYQAVVMTYPLIGNYGICDDDFESSIPSVGALIVHDYNDHPSNFRSAETLDSVMKRFGITGVYGVDTRKLNRSIRDKGSRKALITNISTPLEKGIETLKAAEIPKDAVSKVSVKKSYERMCSSEKYRVAVIDCGIKKSIIDSLVKCNCRVKVFPWNASADEIMSFCPDGLFISNGPGDPSDVKETINTVKSLLGKLPVFGICLGHQILSLAYGAGTYKLKFGHRGGNHPVKDLKTGKIEITSQNHSYAVDPDSLSNTPLIITHINLLDNTVEGIECKEDKAFGVQYHPESSPGPQDSFYLFKRFVSLMEEHRAEKN